jgi:hypothetical protein
MSKVTSEVRASAQADSEETSPGVRRTYEAPRIVKRRSVARVTMLSGSGGTGVGVAGSLVN